MKTLIKVCTVASVVALAAAQPARARTARGLGVREPIPSFSRQTGLACNSCHTAYPQLNGFGRRFKLNGYTMTGLQLIEAGDSTGRSLSINLIPPVSAMVQVSATQIKTTQPGTQNGNVLFPQQLSVFLGEEITPRLGIFLQLTYDPEAGGIGMDNADIRYANHATVGSKDMVFGFTLNNNPTVQDVWNSTPAWGFPFAASSVAPAPISATLIDGGLGQRVAGLGAYALWNNLLYGEISAYRSAPQGAKPLPDSTAEGTLHGVAPYWRLALEHSFGKQYLALGTYGLSTTMYREGVLGPTDHYTDLGLDTQFEHAFGMGSSFTVHATWIHETQTLDASVAAAGADNLSNTLNTFRADASVYAAHETHLVGFTGGVFSTTGSTDALLYGAEPITGSSTGSPNSSGLIGEFTLMPWLNTRFALQYVAYTKFNGLKQNYDGAGRSAADNNTLYLLAWLVF